MRRDANQTFTVGYFNLFANSLPGLKLWLDGNSVDSDHATVDNIANGTAIGSWKDRSSSTNHAVQGTVSNRPTSPPTGSTARVFSVTPPASPRTSPVTRASAPSLRSCVRQPLKPPPPSRSGAISSPPPAPESSACSAKAVV